MNSDADGSTHAAARRPVDARALARRVQRMTTKPAPWLHEEVARRMAERLGLLKQAPRHIVDWGASLGGSAAALRAACPQARLVAADPWAPAAVAEGAAGAAVASSPWWSARRWWPGAATRTAAANPGSHVPESTLAEGEADLLWSNMVLQHQAEPLASMARWLRLLAVDGLLMFSTLGPGSLESLRRLYGQRGWPPPHAPFVDMHDLGDMLVQAGFADPVMDQEVITLTWPTGAAALGELRQLGGNADPARHAGLRTPRWRSTLEAALGEWVAVRPGARVALEFEVVYGHAVRPVPRARVAAETAVSLADMRGMLRGGAQGERDR